MNLRNSTIYAASSIFGVALAVGIGVSYDPPATWEGLSSAASSEFVLVFSPAHCRINGQDILRLNEYADRSLVATRAVMLDPPADSAEQRHLMEAFNLRMPIHLDVEGEWKEALLDAGLPSTGAAIWFRRGVPRRMGAALEWERIAPTNGPVLVGSAE